MCWSKMCVFSRITAPDLFDDLARRILLGPIYGTKVGVKKTRIPDLYVAGNHINIFHQNNVKIKLKYLQN